MELTHKLFIQYMIKNGGVFLEDALNYCQDAVNDINELKLVIRKINKEIHKHNFKISITTCEVTNKDVVLWLNTKDDGIAKFQATFTAIELEYFHALFQEIIISEERKLPFFNALNLTSSLTSFLSRETGQGVLNKWFQQQYFIKEGEFVHLGSRLILEFTSYLKYHCPGQICKLCSELVFNVTACKSCEAIFHSYCLNKYLDKQDKCPSCMFAWAETTQSQTNVENSSVDDFMGTTPSATSRQSSRRKKH